MACPEEVSSVLRIPSKLLALYNNYYSTTSYNTYFLLCVAFGLFFWGLLRQWKSIVQFKKLKSQLSRFPGPPTLPIFGNSLLLLQKQNHEYFDLIEEFTKKHGPILSVWLFHKPYLLISDADVLEKILMSKENLDKGDDMKVFQTWWGTGLLTASATKWKIHRKLLNPTFSHSILISFLDVFNQESAALVNRLDELAQTGKPFNVTPYLTACTLNIICETAMGKKLHPSGEGHQEYIDAVTGMYHILLTRMVKPWLRPDIIWKFSPYGIIEQRYLKILHGFTDKVIRERRLTRKQNKKVLNGDQLKAEKDVAEGGKQKMAFMDYLLNMAESEENTLTDTDIRNEIDTFMAAGHDTTAYTVLWTLFLLATYPEHQVKVQKELDELYKEKDQETVDMNDIYKMTYLGLCIKEAIRIYPIVPLNFRKLSQDIKLDENKVIPAGVNVVTLPFLVHKDPKHFPDPDKFIPERFTASNCKNRHPLAYIPFSAGPRNCIGQKFATYESKVILSYLLRNYEWKVMERRENVKLDLDLVTRPLHDLHFVLSKRI